MGAAAGIPAVVLHAIDCRHYYAFGFWKSGGGVVKIYYVGHSVLLYVFGFLFDFPFILTFLAGNGKKSYKRRFLCYFPVFSYMKITFAS